MAMGTSQRISSVRNQCDPDNNGIMTTLGLQQLDSDANGIATAMRSRRKWDRDNNEIATKMAL
jgi:hypothetical protein